MKQALRLPFGQGLDDDFLQSEIVAATEDAEKFTHRDLRVKTWRLQVSCFLERIVLKRSPVDAITSIEYLKDGAPVVIDPATYYLYNTTSWSWVILADGQIWPNDEDPVLHAISINFTTTEAGCIELARSAIKKHVAYNFQNRGDCPEGPNGETNPFVLSGARATLQRKQIKLI